MKTKTKIKKIVVNVTAKDVKKGSPACLDGACPAKLALLRRVNSLVDVGYGYIKIGKFKVYTPDSVVRFISRFDSLTKSEKAKAKPFRFTLEIPEKYVA